MLLCRNAVSYFCTLWQACPPVKTQCRLPRCQATRWGAVALADIDSCSSFSVATVVFCRTSSTFSSPVYRCDIILKSSIYRCDIVLITCLQMWHCSHHLSTCDIVLVTCLQVCHWSHTPVYKCDIDHTQRRLHYCCLFAYSIQMIMTIQVSCGNWKNGWTGSAGVSIPPEAMVRSPPPRWPDGSPQFLIIMHLKCCADRWHDLSFDNHFETKVLFLMYFGIQIINKFNMMIQIMAEW